MGSKASIDWAKTEGEREVEEEEENDGASAEWICMHFNTGTRTVQLAWHCLCCLMRATISVFPFSWARSRTDFPWWFLASVSAPCFNNSSTHSLWPCSTARIKAVWPSLLFASISAPCLNNSFTHSLWPFKVARIKAVHPVLLLVLTSAPCFSSIDIHSRSPLIAALTIGVWYGQS